MFIPQDRATLINVLKYVLLILAVPWLAFVISMNVFPLVIHLSKLLGITWSGIPGVLFIAAWYAAFSALILRIGIFLVYAKYTQKLFTTSLVMTWLMLPIVFYVMILWG